jgi:hypothetical protein
MSDYFDLLQKQQAMARFPWQDFSNWLTGNLTNNSHKNLVHKALNLPTGSKPKTKSQRTTGKSIMEHYQERMYTKDLPI